MATEATKRINVTFPVSLLEDLRRYVPRRKRNEFIVEATEKELRRRRLLKALRDSAGAWSDEDHPDLMTVEDVNRYVRRLRETWMPRSWDEIVEEAERWPRPTPSTSPYPIFAFTPWAANKGTAT